LEIALADDWEAFRAKAIEEQKAFVGWCSPEKATNMMNLIHDHHAKLCVEVGVFAGCSFYPIVAALAFQQEGVVFAIDPWTSQVCVEGYQPTHHHYIRWSQIDLTKIFYGFLDKMHDQGMDPYYAIMRMSSAQAHAFFSDNSIDFLHIDGDHREASAISDVENWLPKVKSGGIICFDDAWWESTKKAVEMLLIECIIMPESHPQWQHIFLRKR
jgi:predicted O-methyltransferase YrrM